MNHRQFEEWLLREEPLGRHEQKSLRDHLTSCEACSELGISWKEVHTLLRHTEPPAVKAGFTQRWERRLAEEEYHQKSWRGWLVLAMVTVVGVTLALRPGTALLPSFNDLVIWISNGTATMLALSEGMQTVLETFLNFFPQITAIGWLAMVNLAAVVIIAAWLIAMKRLTYAKEYQK
jgi:anti-sigma factor RsiW